MDDFPITKVVMSTLGVVFVLITLTWIAQGNEFFLYKVFAPKYAEVQRQTFEQSHSYNESMAQELRRMQMEYITATPSQKEAIASLILHQYADYDQNNLPQDLQQFLNQIKQERGIK